MEAAFFDAVGEAGAVRACCFPGFADVWNRDGARDGLGGAGLGGGVVADASSAVAARKIAPISTFWPVFRGVAKRRVDERAVKVQSLEL